MADASLKHKGMRVKYICRICLFTTTILEHRDEHLRKEHKVDEYVHYVFMLRRLRTIIEDTCNCPNILQHIDALLDESDKIIDVGL